jgi:hypothetical protein
MYQLEVGDLCGQHHVEDRPQGLVALQVDVAAVICEGRKISNP